jgi:hypothetical protein
MWYCLEKWKESELSLQRNQVQKMTREELLTFYISNVRKEKVERTRPDDMTTEVLREEVCNIKINAIEIKFHHKKEKIQERIIQKIDGSTIIFQLPHCKTQNIQECMEKSGYVVFEMPHLIMDKCTVKVRYHCVFHVCFLKMNSSMDAESLYLEQCQHYI